MNESNLQKRHPVVNKSARTSLCKIKVRLTTEELAVVDRAAADLRIPRATAARLLIADGASARAAGEAGQRGRSDSQELELHLLVGIEQVIALIESFLPQGPGAARRVLPEAVRAARERLDAADDGDGE